MTTRERLLNQIEAYLEATGMSATRFGREAAGDPRLVFDMRERGRTPGVDLMDRLRAFMGAAGNQSGAPEDRPPTPDKQTPDPSSASSDPGSVGPTVLLIIGGGIAAYKTLDLIRRLRERGYRVRAVMTKAAQEFVTPLSVGALTAERVYTDLFDRDDEHDVGHIRLARAADIIVAAPATADLMARLAAGRVDDLATAVVLAARSPLLLAPAMNPAMWNHAATRRNATTLKRDGVHFIGPMAGEMAESNEAGVGRMAEPLEIAARIANLLAPPDDRLAGRRVLVTSGPTHEPIDPVRYLANRSSGRQGHAIAAAAAAAGAEVTLVSGPVTIADPPGVSVVRVESAREMLAAVEEALPVDVAIMAAAVADWRVADSAESKIKKDGSGRPPALALVENPDILATLGHIGDRRPDLLIGFAAETDDILRYGEGKRRRKGADWILANDVSPESGVMGGSDNEIHLISADGVDHWPRMSKTDAAKKLVDRIALHLGGSVRAR